MIESANYQFLACFEDSSFMYKQKHQQQHDRQRRRNSGARGPAHSPRSQCSCSSGTSSNAFSSSSDDSSCSSGRLEETLDESSPSASLIWSESEEAATEWPDACPLSALDYCRLSSISPAAPQLASHSSRTSGRKRRQEQESGSPAPQATTSHGSERRATRAVGAKRVARGEHQVGPSLPSRCVDPVYLEDESVFENLIAKERAEMRRNCEMSGTTMITDNNCDPCNFPIKSNGNNNKSPVLHGQKRHSLLSWMLHICEQQACQDDVFPLSTMILDKFLQLKRLKSGSKNTNPIDQLDADSDPDAKQATTIISQDINNNDDNELEKRQLCLFAACALLLASKFRQTMRLSVESLCHFSATELPLALSRSEILDGEFLMLTLLGWDLAALVTPNDYLAMLQSKCLRIQQQQETTTTNMQSKENQATQDKLSQKQQQQRELEIQLDQNALLIIAKLRARCDYSKVRGHTQTLLELCLMGK